MNTDLKRKIAFAPTPPLERDFPVPDPEETAPFEGETPSLGPGRLMEGPAAGPFQDHPILILEEVFDPGIIVRDGPEKILQLPVDGLASLERNSRFI